MVARKQIIEVQQELLLEDAKRPRKRLLEEEPSRMEQAMDRIRNTGAAPSARQEAVEQGKDPHWPFREEIREVTIKNVIQGSPIVYSGWFDLQKLRPPESGFWELRQPGKAPIKKRYWYEASTDLWAIFGATPHRPSIYLEGHEWRGLAQKWQEVKRVRKVEL